MADPSDKTEWLPEMFGDAAVYRIEHAKQELWDNLCALLPDNQILKQPGVRLAFERADLNAESSTVDHAKATPVNWVFFHPFHRRDEKEKKRVTAAVAELKNNGWEDHLQSISSDHSVEIIKQLKGFDKTPHASFHEILTRFAAIPLTGWLSETLAADYFGQSTRPVLYVGTASKEISGLFFGGDGLNAQLISERIIAKTQQQAKRIGNLEIANQLQARDTATAFFEQLYTRVILVPPESEADTFEIVVLSLPLFTHNGRLIDSKVTAPSGTFVGWLRLEYPVEQKSKNGEKNTPLHRDLLDNSKSLGELLSILLHLADTFAQRLMDDAIAESISRLAATRAIKAEDFLKEHLHHISGWVVCDASPADRTNLNLPFAFNGDNLTVWLEGNCFEGYDKIITLCPKATTAIPSDEATKTWFGGHVAYRLRAIWSQLDSLYHKNRADNLQKFEEMMRLLADPLKNMTNALADMQRDAQELRAILYDPGKALFESHSELAKLYEDGADFDSISEHIRFKLAHQPSSYDARPDDARCVLAYALLMIFGRQKNLQDKRCETAARVVNTALSEIAELARTAAFAEMIEDVVWLISSDNIELPPADNAMERTAALTISLHSAFATPSVSLDRLKHAIHYPFKVDESAWYGWPLLLALKRYTDAFNNCFKVKEKCGNAAGPEFIKLFSLNTPATFSSVLRLLIGVCAAKVSSQVPRPLQTCTVAMSGRDTKAEVTITAKVSDLDGDKDGNLRKAVQRVASVPRDWRIRHAAQGNFHGPFLDFVGELLGVSSNAKGGGNDEWTLKRCKGTEILRLQKGDRSFAVSITDNILSLEWKVIQKNKKK